MVNKQFEIDVKTALLINEMSLTDLAGELGISVSYTCDIVKGNRRANKHRERIIKILGIKPKSYC